jgi:hypothetical protein
MRARVCSVVFLLLAGCRDAGGSANPEAGPLTSPVASVDGGAIKGAEAAAPKVSSPVAPTVDAPAEPEAPAKAPEPFAAEESVDVGGLPIGVRIDQQPSAEADAAPTATLLVSIGGATQGDRLLSLPTGFDGCEQVEAVVEPVAGEPSPLVLAQAFCEHGEDEFSRDILSAVVHVGDAATPPRVLWQGEGSFSSSFGVCLHSDVPFAEVPRAGTLLIEQMTEVEHTPDRDLPQIRCRAKKARTRKLAEIAF